jgi:hypothetical protein
LSNIKSQIALLLIAIFGKKNGKGLSREWAPSGAYSHSSTFEVEEDPVS